MKTYDNLFEIVCSFEHLLRSFYLCRKGKTYRIYALEFEANLEENLFELQEELRTGMWEPQGYTTFYVYDPKKRLINAPTFRDRIVHRAVHDVIEPIWERIFIYDSYACRKGKGTHKGVDRLTKFLRSYPPKQKVYCFKADIESYFASVDHEILFKIIKRKIVDKELLSVIWKIIDSYHEEGKLGVGIPLGNLTSQLFANIVLNELDYFIKHELRVKHYIRYMDDFVMLHPDKKQLWAWRDEIAKFLKKLKLQLHPKKQIVFPASKGIDFLGYIVFRDHRRVRRRNVHRFYQRLKKIANGTFDKDPEQSIMSWMGYTIHADAYGLNKSIAKKYPILEIGLKKFYPDTK
ncbi:reverse transcriptase/maturase family protein [Archaeoglobus sp. JdFR-39]|uniref:reverse transcriptase/maturase family protein n=1 Tax=Archaeoglobus sp. JdFR-39 TaxID=1934996 RepID=UPI0025BB9C9D|nr:reverse transcriptase/maturase family protein [Archaeoglobus sp. JdFR-39]